MKLEVPIFTSTFPSSPVPHRLELNAPGSYPQGGLTPPLSILTTIASSPALKQTPLRIMIRPRGKPSFPEEDPDFLYSEAELEQMKASIRSFRQSGLLDPKRGDGFVFGVLKRDVDGKDVVGGVVVDVERNAALVKEAAGFGCTLHRAVDDVLGAWAGRGGSVVEVAEEILSCGFGAVLTSGGPGNAPDNLPVLAQFVAAVAGKVEVIIGGGVRTANKNALVDMFGHMENVWLHSSCLRRGMIDERELEGLLDGV